MAKEKKEAPLQGDASVAKRIVDSMIVREAPRMTEERLESYEQMGMARRLAAEARRARAREEKLERIRRAAQALFDAPHQEHFAVRLNDEENVALEELRAALAATEGGVDNG